MKGRGDKISGDKENLAQDVAKNSYSVLVINDIKPYIAARNLRLLLPLGSYDESDLLIDIVIHPWYSSFLTKEMENLLLSVCEPKLEKMGPAVFCGSCDQKLIISTKFSLCGDFYNSSPCPECSEVNFLHASHKAKKARHDVTLVRNILNYRSQELCLIPQEFRASQTLSTEDGLEYLDWNSQS